MNSRPDQEAARKPSGPASPINRDRAPQTSGNSITGWTSPGRRVSLLPDIGYVGGTHLPVASPNSSFGFFLCLFVPFLCILLPVLLLKNFPHIFCAYRLFFPFACRKGICKFLLFRFRWVPCGENFTNFKSLRRRFPVFKNLKVRTKILTGFGTVMVLYIIAVIASAIGQIGRAHV